MTHDPATLLATPLGLPGSGRVRYGAAMALFREGRIGDAELEVFRIASARDDEDPALHLAEKGLPAPPAVEPEPQSVIAVLADEAERYLAGLSLPGAAEVRLLLAGRTEPPRPQPGPPNAVVEAHLVPALGAAADSVPALAAAIAAAAPHLTWITYDAYVREEIGASFADGHAYAPLTGPGSPYEAVDFSFGVFLIAPHVLYRDHCHRAPELYAPLTGPHGWRFGPDRPLIVKDAHEPVWNDPYRPHLTKVGPTPFLCLFGWTRDVAGPATVIPASDWAELEALRL